MFRPESKSYPDALGVNSTGSLPARGSELTEVAALPAAQPKYAGATMPLIQRRVATAHVPSGIPIQLLADLVSQIVITNDIITAASLPSRDRTDGVLGGNDGSHTSPWSLLVEGVRNAVVGKNLDQAVAGMDRLMADAKALPGNARVKFMLKNQQDHYNRALEKMELASLNAAFNTSQDTVQQYMSAYLEFRNLVPLSAVDTGSPANYNLEADGLDILRNYSLNDEGTVRTAVFSLLDKKTISKISEEIEMTETVQVNPHLQTQVNADVPGIDYREDIENRLSDLIMQHLQTVKSAFPEAFYKANIDKDKIVAYYFPGYQPEDDFDEEASENSDEDVRIDEGNFRGLLNVPARGALLPVKNSIGKNVPGGSVQIKMADNGTIQNALINTSDRPDGLFKSADKKHSTAWIVFVRGAQRAVVGKTLQQAVQAMTTLYEETYNLPGVSRGFLLEETVKKRWLQAMNEAETAKEAANANVNVNTLQQFIRAYLRFRNFVPLTAADSDAVGPGGDAEGTNVAKLGNYANYPEVELTKAIYGLLDAGVVHAHLHGKGRKAVKHDKKNKDKDPFSVGPPKSVDITDNADTIDTDLPGISLDQQPHFRAAAVLRQHLMTIRMNFPEAYDKAKPAKQEYVDYYLQHNVEVENSTLRGKIFAAIKL